MTRTAKPISPTQAIENEEVRKPGEERDTNGKTEQSRSND